ncbi:MAG TPA: trypsin-like peptidase domain-containing protein, partial [Rhodanobacteraceae bacterium]
MLRRAKKFAAVFVLLCFSGIGVAFAATPATSLPNFVGIVQKYGPAVVNVVAHYNHASEMGSDHPSGQNSQPQQQQAPQIPEIFRFFGMPFGPGMMQPQESGPAESIGSGFIISSDGYIVTNRHVVAHANSIEVTLPDHRSYSAKLIGEDKIYDIAVLKIDATGLPSVQIGNSNDLKAGQWVVAIGSPMGLTHSVSAGIVSYVGRSLGRGDQPTVPFIQTDVPINRGNSGGPLFNMAGQVIGINSQIESTTGGAMGLSFSIPINIAMDAAKQLETKGYVSRGMIGVSLQPMTEGVAKKMDIPNGNAALVSSVQPDGPAAKGGMKPGDAITEFNGHRIYNRAELLPLVAMTAPGTEAKVTVLRDGKPVHLTIKIGEMPRNGLTPQLIAGAPPATSGHDLLGLTVQDITPQMRQQLGFTGDGGVA